MSKEGDYPSPTAGQAGGPYHDHQAESQLRAQLEAAQVNDHVGNEVNAFAQGNHELAQLQYHMQQQQSPQMGMLGGHGSPSHGVQQQVGFAEASGSDQAKKKSKVTRACDECRRKKIKCDAEPEVVGQKKCSNCTRTNSECLFSKPTQKRGPSRGYIRDLADRLSAVESRDLPTSPFTPGQQSPTMGLPMQGNKRSRSEFEADGNYSGARATMARLAQKIPQMNPTAPVNRSEITPITLTEDEKQTLATFSSIARQGPFLAALVNVNDVPFLLISATDDIRTTFFAAVQAVLAAHTNDQMMAIHAFTRVMNTTAISPAAFDLLSNVVRLISTALVTYALSYAEHPNLNHGAGPQLEVIIGVAVSLLNYLQPHYFEVESAATSDHFVYFYGRRAFWTMTILDHFHAVGMNRAPLVDISKADLISGDKEVLGVELGALSNVVKGLYVVGISLRQRKVDDSELFKTYQMAKVHLHAVQFWGPEPGEYPLLTLMVDHVRSLFDRDLLKGVELSRLDGFLKRALNMVDHLLMSRAGAMPISHHFVALAALDLMAAADTRALKTEATNGLKKLRDGLEDGTLLPFGGWKHLILNAVKNKIDTGLQDLANAAVGAAGGADQDEEEDDAVELTQDVVKGYLNAFL